ncbi:MAG: hypothetical protein ACOC2W_03730 [bacterium]
MQILLGMFIFYLIGILFNLYQSIKEYREQKPQYPMKFSFPKFILTLMSSWFIWIKLYYDENY